MNVYDFDKTIYCTDSTVDFWKFCLKRNPKTLFELIPTAFCGVFYSLRFIDRTGFKQKFFRFLKYIPDIDAAVSEFWADNESGIKKWYLEQKRDDDVIISASPEFLLAPVCEKLGVCLIATKADKKTGKISGANCRGEEKVKRFYAIFPDGVIDGFYSDSHADDPLAAIAKSAYWVDGDKITPWEQFV